MLLQDSPETNCYLHIEHCYKYQLYPFQGILSMDNIVDPALTDLSFSSPWQRLPGWMGNMWCLAQWSMAWK